MGCLLDFLDRSLFLLKVLTQESCHVGRAPGVSVGNQDFVDSRFVMFGFQGAGQNYIVKKAVVRLPIMEFPSLARPLVVGEGDSLISSPSSSKHRCSQGAVLHGQGGPELKAENLVRGGEMLKHPRTSGTPSRPYESRTVRRYGSP